MPLTPMKSNQCTYSHINTCIFTTHTHQKKKKNINTCVDIWRLISPQTILVKYRIQIQGSFMCCHQIDEWY